MRISNETNYTDAVAEGELLLTILFYQRGARRVSNTQNGIQARDNNFQTPNLILTNRRCYFGRCYCLQL